MVYRDSLAESHQQAPLKDKIYINNLLITLLSILDKCYKDPHNHLRRKSRSYPEARGEERSI
jgi:hypothetical protein